MRTVRRWLYVELALEDPLSASDRYVGKLERAMYRTPDAPMIWQDHLRKTLLDMKFKESVAHPGVFQHETRDILFCVHVDDLLCTGLREDLLWLKLQLLKEYELETKLMDDDEDLEKTAVYLGRTLEWSEDGLGVRPDRRHVRSLLRELGMETCRSVSTPLSLTEEKEGEWSDRPEVSAELATKHRAAVARVVYLAQDRLDLGVVALELAKTMAIPIEGDSERLKCFARYLHGNPDCVQWYPLQEETNTVVLSTDADWATCRETRRSHSGGTVMLGNHLITAWSWIQPRIALSSGEAELHAGLRGVSGTLGFVHMMREFHTQDWCRITHRVDASACRAMMLRRGCGGLKHITVKSLWVQEAVREYFITIERVPRDAMLAHILASPSSADTTHNTSANNHTQHHHTHPHTTTHNHTQPHTQNHTLNHTHTTTHNHTQHHTQHTTTTHNTTTYKQPGTTRNT